MLTSAEEFTETGGLFPASFDASSFSEVLLTILEPLASSLGDSPDRLAVASVSATPTGALFVTPGEALPPASTFKASPLSLEGLLFLPSVLPGALVFPSLDPSRLAFTMADQGVVKGFAGAADSCNTFINSRKLVQVRHYSVKERQFNKSFQSACKLGIVVGTRRVIIAYLDLLRLSFLLLCICFETSWLTASFHSRAVFAGHFKNTTQTTITSCQPVQ